MITTQKIQDWGNSKGIRIPQKIIAGKQWQGVTEVTMSVSGDQITLTPAKPAGTPSLDELISSITPENLHQSIDFGPPAGQELL